MTYQSGTPQKNAQSQSESRDLRRIHERHTITMGLNLPRPESRNWPCSPCSSKVAKHRDLFFQRQSGEGSGHLLCHDLRCATPTYLYQLTMEHSASSTPVAFAWRAIRSSPVVGAITGFRLIRFTNCIVLRMISVTPAGNGSGAGESLR